MVIPSKIKRLLKKGGYLAGKDKSGQSLKLTNSKRGGIAVGAKHGPEGGIKGTVGTEAKPIEFEGEEIIITAPAVKDNTRREFNGKMMTNREILSEINQSGGGVAFADGGEVPGKIKAAKGQTYKVGGKPMTARQVVEYCGCGCAHEKMETGGDVKDFSAIGRKIKKSVRSDEAFEILDADKELEGSTWSAGGCYPLALAIKEVYGGQLKFIVNDKGIAQHVIVKVEGGYLDADGFSDINRKLKIQKSEGVDSPALADFNKKKLGSIGIGSKDTVDKMVKLLSDKGSFAEGGSVSFSDKVAAIAKSLNGQPVPAQYQKEYGKKYTAATARKAATKIAGAMVRDEKMEYGGQTGDSNEYKYDWGSWSARIWESPVSGWRWEINDKTRSYGRITNHINIKLSTPKEAEQDMWMVIRERIGHYPQKKFAEGGHIDLNDFKEKFNLWRNGPGYSSAIRLLNSKDIDYIGWTDVDIYKWYVEYKDDDTEEEEFARGGQLKTYYQAFPQPSGTAGESQTWHLISYPEFDQIHGMFFQDKEDAEKYAEKNGIEIIDYSDFNKYGQLIDAFKNVDNPGHSMVQAYKHDPAEMIKFVQEQATGLDAATRTHIHYPPAYHSAVKMVGAGLVQQAIVVLPQKHKDMLIKAWKGKIVPKELRDAVKQTFEDGGIASSFKETLGERLIKYQPVTDEQKAFYEKYISNLKEISPNQPERWYLYQAFENWNRKLQREGVKQNLALGGILDHRARDYKLLKATVDFPEEKFASGGHISKNPLEMPKQQAKKYAESASRTELIQLLKQNDPNGVYTDKDSLQEFGKIASKEDLIESFWRSWDGPNEEKFAAGGPTETRYQIKDNSGGYYSRLGGSEHFNSVADFGLLYDEEEAEDVKDWLQKRGYTGLAIVPYVPQPEHAYAAGGPIETPQALGAALKAFFKAKYGLTILTRYIKTVRGLDGSWYEVSTYRSGQIIPNELRQEIIKRFKPNAELQNWDDISYGNIRPQNISLYGREWKEFLQAQEGKMEKGGNVTKIKPKSISLSLKTGVVEYTENPYKEANEAMLWVLSNTTRSNLEYVIVFKDGLELKGSIDLEPPSFWEGKKTPFTWHINTFWPNLAYWKEPLTGLYNKEDIDFARNLVEKYDLGKSEDWIDQSRREVKIISEEITTPNQTDEDLEDIDETWDPAKGKILKNLFERYYESHLKEKFGIKGRSFDGLTVYLKFKFGEGSLDFSRNADTVNYSPVVYEKLKALSKLILSLQGTSHDEALKILSGGTTTNQKPETSNYANAYELNKAIEKLLDSKPNDADFTADEKSFLKYYSGYGGLEKFGATGKGLLYEYYTPSMIAEKMWGLAYKYGFKGGPVLEPSAGIGEFIKYAPEQHLVVAHEINKYSARICKILYPDITISTQYFEEIFIKNNDSIKGKIGLLPKYKLVIGNPPYGEFGGKWAGMGEKNYTRAGNYIDYFIFRGLDLLEPGGLLIFIVGAEVASGGKCFLSQQMNKCKEEIQEKSDLLDAYRLPNGVFERTDVLSDIIVLRKK